MPRRTRPVIIINNDADREKDVYEKAFKTKVGKNSKASKQIKQPDASRLILTQWFVPGTWFVDLVKCGEFWYVFFVEGNSRFLKVYPGNASLNEATGNNETVIGRVKSNSFLNIFTQFRRNTKDLKLLVGDSEKAFWSREMMHNYSLHNIKTKIINTRVEGHNGLAILNRVVRTIRDMNYNIKGPDTILIAQMRRLVSVYNRTKHSTLSEVIGRPVTPAEAYKNIDIQQQYIRAAKSNNWIVQHMDGYQLPIGTKVKVKNISPSLLGKRRETWLPDEWTIIRVDGSIYTLDNNSTGQQITRSRRDIKL